MTEFEQLLYAADRNINAIRELKETRETLSFLTGVMVGCFSTVVFFAIAWGIWRIVR